MTMIWSTSWNLARRPVPSVSSAPLPLGDDDDELHGDGYSVKERWQNADSWLGRRLLASGGGRINVTSAAFAESHVWQQAVLSCDVPWTLVEWRDVGRDRRNGC